jgi:hypothetical protein
VKKKFLLPVEMPSQPTLILVLQKLSDRLMSFSSNDLKEHTIKTESTRKFCRLRDRLPKADFK